MMKNIGLILGISLATISFPLVTQAESSLYLAYPPPEHTTTASKIFFIGTASPQGKVFINDQGIERSEMGHFAPSFPLKMGGNKFILRYGNETIERVITRIPTQPKIPNEVAFAPDSLTPKENIARLPGELICFKAVAPSDATVKVEIANQTVSLFPQSDLIQLPPNAAIYTTKAEADPPVETVIGEYQGCTTFSEPGFVGHPLFKLSLADKSIVKQSNAKINILSPNQLEVIEVTSDRGVTRTGPSTDYSRLTPLPQGTRAAVTGTQGEWLRLDYGGWIKQEETTVIPHHIPPQSLIRYVTAKILPNTTEIIFPLQTPIPISIKQGEKSLTLTLYNTTAQTDTIRFNDHPYIKRLDWQQIRPQEVEYTLHFKSEQQWGYDVRYEENNLILSIRHPPMLSSRRMLPLQGISILLDPGHGGSESGSRGPTGYSEKEINLLISQLLAQELTQRGATVYLTRKDDTTVSLEDRVKMIDQLQPNIALSIHYNALPDEGDAVNTAGISTYWYHPQAHDLSVFIHNYLVEKLNRPSHGVYWNNLALTRPHTTPSVLLELGFMINPTEFEWITNSQAQGNLVKAIADAISVWFDKVKS